jgi:hypothetical protein
MLAPTIKRVRNPLLRKLLLGVQGRKTRHLEASPKSGCEKLITWKCGRQILHIVGICWSDFSFESFSVVVELRYVNLAFRESRRWFRNFKFTPG